MEAVLLRGSGPPRLGSKAGAARDAAWILRLAHLFHRFVFPLLKDGASATLYPVINTEQLGLMEAKLKTVCPPCDFAVLVNAG